MLYSKFTDEFKINLEIVLPFQKKKCHTHKDIKLGENVFNKKITRYNKNSVCCLFTSCH